MSISASLVKELREKTGVGMMDCKKALSETSGDLDEAVKYLRERGLAMATKKADRSAKEGRFFTEISGSTAGVVELNCETDFVASNDAFTDLGKSLAKAVIDQNIESQEALESATVNDKPISEHISATVLKVGENLVLGKTELIKADGTVADYSHMNGKIAVVVAFSATVDADLARDVAMHIAASNPSYVNRDQIPQEELNKEREILKTQVLNEGKPEAIVDKIVEGKISKYCQGICLVDQVFVKNSDQKVADILPEGVHVSNFKRYSIVD